VHMIDGMTTTVATIAAKWKRYGRCQRRFVVRRFCKRAHVSSMEVLNEPAN
jgi:hypothetical protein